MSCSIPFRKDMNAVLISLSLVGAPCVRECNKLKRRHGKISGTDSSTSEESATSQNATGPMRSRRNVSDELTDCELTYKRDSCYDPAELGPLALDSGAELPSGRERIACRSMLCSTTI